MKDKEKKNISMKEMLTKRSIEPITNCNCKVESRIDYAVRNENKAGAFVNLLNQEIASLQKAKAIEEMAKDLKECLPSAWYWQKSVDSDTYCVAKHLYNAGFRKLLEDSVVLSKEEYEKRVPFELYKVAKILYNEKCEELKQASKETVEKIFDLVYDYGQDYFVEEKHMKENDFNQMLNQLKKEVEIKE